MKYAKLQEEDLKIKVASDFFGKFDYTVIENIDFAVKDHGKRLLDSYFLWAEAKAAQTDICEMLTQLVLTIGKARTFDRISPPPFLGCFDREKIAFVPFHAVQEIFYQNDFNWKIAPSKRDTLEFKQVYSLIKSILYEESGEWRVESGEYVRQSPTCISLPTPHSPLPPFIFDFEKDEGALKRFIRENFIVGKSDVTKIRVDKNNFINVYNRWLEAVKPTIEVNWKLAKKAGIHDGEFYLADLLSRENETLKEKLFVLLKSDHYVLDRKIDEATGFFSSKKADFTDGQKAHNQFWAIYERPPLEEYWDYIIERRDLLVPQDIRERKGSFFTPRIWVELSQQYLADTLGKDWQDEYYVWDCAAGTGNLLTGLTNKYNIWASTLDKADVDVMHQRIDNGANLLPDHVFQFDFLNDDFSKLPSGLRSIIDDQKLRKKLIVYINPPYAEVSTIGGGKAGVNQSKIHGKYTSQLGTAGRELFALFLARIYCEIPGCRIAEFSTLKTLQGSSFEKFRGFFNAQLEKMFIIPASTFDNVSGKFSTGFKIWDTDKNVKFKKGKADIFNSNGNFIGKKSYRAYDKKQYINKWISLFKGSGNINIGWMDGINGNDFPHNNIVFIVNNKEQMPNPRGIWININNLIPVSIYFTVRKCIEHTWINHNDQFLYPNNKWKKDVEFQNDCLAYTLFHGKNTIQSKHGVNHWIPFLESEVSARSKFDSHFMMSFISGKSIQNRYSTLFEQDGEDGFIKREFSAEAKAVFDAGKKLWTYYHAQPKCNVNASLYDIREYFQGRNDKGKMHNKSDDETYNALMADLRLALKTLTAKIESKVYEYGFLNE